jgi:hypothetical protein
MSVKEDKFLYIDDIDCYNYWAYTLKDVHDSINGYELEPDEECTIKIYELKEVVTIKKTVHMDKKITKAKDIK